MGFSFIIKLTNCLTFRLSRWVNYIDTLKADSFSKLLQQRKSEGPNMRGFGMEEESDVSIAMLQISECPESSP